MVRRIFPSTKDTFYLESLTGLRSRSTDQPQNYRELVVLKPWGYEFLLFENEHVAAWFLHIKREFATSMHTHPHKRTSLILLKGRSFCNTLTQRIFLTGPDAVVYEPGVFHSTKALSDGGIDLIEIESPPVKTDLVRLSDGYGRQSSGYEGTSEMVRAGLEKFGYFYLDPPTVQVITSHCTVTLHQDCARPSDSHADTLCCLCGGTLFKSDGTQVDYAETVRTHELGPGKQLSTVLTVTT